MKMVALQPGYLPWIGFFGQMARCDLFIIEDALQYTKQDWRNRNRILGANGAQYLTVPIHLPSTKTAIRDIKICHDGKWEKRHWNLIKENYRKAPFFKECGAFFQRLYQKKWVRLLDLNMEIIYFVKEFYQLPCQLRLLSEIECPFDPNDKTGSLLRLCRKTETSVFLEGEKGEGFIDRSLFEKEGIGLEFFHFEVREYRQQYSPFLSHLSIIDLLFNMGEEGKKYLA